MQEKSISEKLAEFVQEVFYPLTDHYKIEEVDFKSIPACAFV